MKLNFRNTLAVIIGFLLSLSCSKEYTPYPTGEPYQIAIWGEIVEQNQHIDGQFYVERVPNLTHLNLENERLTPKDIDAISLRNKDNIEVPLSFKENHFYAYSLDDFASPFHLTVTIGGKTYTATTSMPRPIEIVNLQINKQAGNEENIPTFQFDLDLHSDSPNYCIIDLVQTNVNGAEYNIQLFDIIGESLNNKYNELNPTTDAIYIDNLQKRHLSFKTSAIIDAYSKTFLRVRSISPAYFKLLYSLDVQKTSSNVSAIQATGNIKNGLGGFGAISLHKVAVSEVVEE